MRVFLITQDEPFYLYDDIKPLLAEGIVVGATVLSQKLPTDSVFKLADRYLNIFGIIGFLKLGLKTVYYKFALQRDLVQQFKVKNIPVIDTQSINDASYIDRVRELRPDYIVSIACPQKLRAEILKVPTQGAINLHGGYLPDFPGVFTPFWNLVKESTHAGCTVHWMNAEIDGGDIIARDRFEIKKGQTMMDLYREISARGVRLLMSALKRLAEGTAERIPNPKVDGAYNSFPSKEDLRNFKKLGHRAI